MLRASAHALIVTPTGDNSETEHGSLIVVNSAPADGKIYRGVVRHVGPHVLEVEQGLDVGCVAHYLKFVPLLDQHVVSSGHLVAWEALDDD